MNRYLIVLLSRALVATAGLVALVLIQLPLIDARYAGAQQAPAITVEPASAAPNERVTLRGSGWPAGSQLVARIYESTDVGGPSSPLDGAIQADASGGFSVQATLPNSLFGQGSRGTLNLVPGSYTIVAAATPSPSASAPFTVGAPAQGVLLWGQLFYDTNNDQKISEGDTPARGLSPITITGNSPDRPAAQAISDARGRYMALNLQPGEYAPAARGQLLSMDWSGTATASGQDGQAVRADILLRPAAPDVNSERYFPETGFAIEDDQFWDYFTHRGGVRTLGYPISRTFTFQGYPTQFFQRIVLQSVPGQGVRRLNLLDPGLMPYTRINGSQFPPLDPQVKEETPRVSDPGYGEKVIEFVARYAVNELGGRRVGFYDAFTSTVKSEDAFPQGGGEELVPLLNLEIWGTPTSRPTPDPSNGEFVYLRFQRGILHFQGHDGQGNPITEGILLGDWFKSLITGRNLPADLEAQARAEGSPFLRQYDPGKPGWVADPARLPDTDMTFAFEPR